MDSRADDASSVSPSLTNEEQNKASNAMDEEDLEETGLNNVPSSGTKQKITRKRYTKGMVSFLLDAVDEIVPTGNRDWEAVATKFNLEFKDNRDHISVRKKFLDLASKASVPALQTSENAKADLVAKKINAKLGPGPAGTTTTEQNNLNNSNSAAWESSSVVSSVNGSSVQVDTFANPTKGRNSSKPLPSSSPSTDHPLDEEENDEARVSLLGKRSKDELYASNPSLSTLSTTQATTTTTCALPTAQSKGLSAILYRMLHRPIVRTPHPLATSSNGTTINHSNGTSHQVSAEATRNQSPNSVSSSQVEDQQNNNNNDNNNSLPNTQNSLLSARSSEHQDPQESSMHTDLVYDTADTHAQASMMECDDSF